MVRLQGGTRIGNVGAMNHIFNYFEVKISIFHFQALFVANGPAFKSGLIAEPFSNIEVYNLLAGMFQRLEILLFFPSII